MPSQDAVGCELWGAYKNTVALSVVLSMDCEIPLAGIIWAALVTIGFAEGQRLLPLMGGSTGNRIRTCRIG